MVNLMSSLLEVRMQYAQLFYPLSDEYLHTVHFGQPSYRILPPVSSHVTRILTRGWGYRGSFVQSVMLYCAIWFVLVAEYWVSLYQCCCLVLFPSTGQDIHCPPILGKVRMLNQYNMTLHVCDAFAMYMYLHVRLPFTSPTCTLQSNEVYNNIILM